MKKALSKFKTKFRILILGSLCIRRNLGYIERVRKETARGSKSDRRLQFSPQNIKTVCHRSQNRTDSRYVLCRSYKMTEDTKQWITSDRRPYERENQAK